MIKTIENLQACVFDLYNIGGLQDSEFATSKMQQATADARMYDVLQDSLDYIEFIMLIEDTFKIEITDDEAETCKTFGDLLKVINSRMTRFSVQ